MPTVRRCGQCLHGYLWHGFPLDGGLVCGRCARAARDSRFSFGLSDILGVLARDRAKRQARKAEDSR